MRRDKERPGVPGLATLLAPAAGVLFYAVLAGLLIRWFATWEPPA